MKLVSPLTVRFQVHWTSTFSAGLVDCSGGGGCSLWQDQNPRATMNRIVGMAGVDLIVPKLAWYSSVDAKHIEWPDCLCFKKSAARCQYFQEFGAFFFFSRT